MPESKIRKEAAEKKKLANIAAAAEKQKQNKPAAPGSGNWVAPTFITVGLLGVAWLVVYYLTASLSIFLPVMAAPPDGIGGWNIIVGMGLMALAFIIATQWGKK